MIDRDRWAKLDALLDQALDHPPEERARFLEEACGEDAKLRAEVEKLLSLAEREDDALRPEAAFTGPLGEAVARELGHSLEPGDELGSYRLVEFLGRGGMGHVYAAEDRKLGRQVALKLLPPELASPERRRRFEREAKAVAALNHPNIVHLYSVEEVNGMAFITLELVRGRTLGECILPGGLALKKLLSTAIPLADALASAHQAGIIHRDLKPGNVMIGDDGRVKILDFGLAKTFRESGQGPLAKLTRTATQEGHIIGTVSHMSPEQAEGRPIDHRTDIFSLGVILYEMATGQLPFQGDTPASTLSSIIKDTPRPVTEINPRLPRDLARIIKRCLAKDPDRRYQTATDVRNELEELDYALDSRKLFQFAVSRSRRVSLGVVSALVAVALALALALSLIDREERAPELLSGSFSQLTTEPGAELFPSLSPDGSFFVYASRAAGNWDVYLLRAGGRRPICLTEDSSADDTQPVFSPDGESIAFRSSRGGGGIFVMGATGESVRRLTAFGWNPSWAPDGNRLVFATEAISRTPEDRPTTSALWTVDVAVGKTELVFEGDAVQPSWSPHGHRIAYWGLIPGTAQRDIFTIPANGGKPSPVTRDAALDWNPMWSPDGEFLYFASDRGGSMNLWRLPIDELTGEPQGQPEPVRAPAAFATHVSFSRDGRRMAYTSILLTETLESVPFDPTTETVGTLDRRPRDIRAVSAPRVSPDGEWIAYSRVGIQEDIVLVRPDGSEERLLTDDSYRDRYPRWSPDGEEIAFYSNRGGTYEIWSVNRDGSGLRPLTDAPDHPTRYPIFSPDGTRLLFSSPGVTGMVFDPHIPWSEQAPEVLPAYPEPGEEFVPLDWSPDGKHLAGYLLSSDGVRAGIATYSFDTSRFDKLTDFGLFPAWMSDSRRIVFQGLGPERSTEQPNNELEFRIFLVDRVTKEFREVLSLPGASVEGPVLAPDRDRLYFVVSRVEADVWMLSTDEET